jgi:hypothetical protein
MGYETSILHPRQAMDSLNDNSYQDIYVRYVIINLKDSLVEVHI